MTQLAVCLRAPALWNTCVCTWCSKAVINNVMHTWVCCVRCRAAGQLAAGIIKAAQNDAAGKLLLTRALKTAHGSMGNHQLVAQVPAAASTAARLCDQPLECMHIRKLRQHAAPCVYVFRTAVAHPEPQMQERSQADQSGPGLTRAVLSCSPEALSRWTSTGHLDAGLITATPPFKPAQVQVMHTSTAAAPGGQQVTGGGAAQVLVALGPLQAKPPNADPRGGRDMCSNSYTLAKALGDLPTQIAAVDAVLQCPRQPLTPNPNPAPCMASGCAAQRVLVLASEACRTQAATAVDAEARRGVQGRRSTGRVTAEREEGGGEGGGAAAPHPRRHAGAPSLCCAGALSLRGGPPATPHVLGSCLHAPAHRAVPCWRQPRQRCPVRGNKQTARETRHWTQIVHHTRSGPLR